MSDPEYDIIFAGGGTAACLIASRLSAASPSLKILIIESGDHTKDKPEHVQPARYLSHLAPISQTVTFHTASANDAVGGREIVVPTGRAVGGGSSVNFMMYTRAAASDYDDWETVYSNKGWGSKDLIPLLRKMENYQVGEPGSSDVHGYSGPLKVSMGGVVTEVGTSFLDVARQYDKERESTDDTNGLFECNKYGPWPKWIEAENGTRSDVPHHFIYNMPEKNCLVIETAKRVHRVLFEGDTAVGVEYVNDLVTNPGADQTFQTARASKMVIVSAGSFGSPAILERSGIGSREVLEKLGVDVKVDLPGVGASYKDHNGIFVSYAASDDTVSLDHFLRGEPEEVNRLIKVWTETGKGLLAHNGIDAGVKLRPTPAELEGMPGFADRWNSYFKDAPDKPVLWLGPIAMHLGAPMAGLPSKCFSMGCYTTYPEAEGSLHITSASNPHAIQQFESGFLTKYSDVEVLKWGYKRGRELARRMSMYRGAVMKPEFSADSQARFLRNPGEDSPVEISAQDVEYSKEDDQALEAFVRKHVGTTWHALGTCPAKPRQEGGVVDPALSVYGCRHLKVADLSIAPGNVGSNTYSTALVIAEKATVIFAAELGIDLG